MYSCRVIQATVTRFPGVQRRADSGIYQFGLRAPKDLLAHFPGGWATRVSLKTSDLREANAKAKALHAEWDARFEALRTGKPRPIDMPDLRRRLFAQWERAIAHLDDTYSRVPGKDRETRAHGLQCQIDELRQCLTEGVLPEWLEDGAKNYGDATAPEIVTEYGGHQLMLLEVMHEALTDERRTFPLRVQYTRQRRDVMGLNAAPALHALPDSQAPQQPATAVNGKKIGDAYDAWVTIRQAPERTQQTYKRHANQFVALMGDLPLDSVSRTIGIEFRDKLQAWAIENNKTATTADNILVSLRALFNVARDKGWVTGNPLERLQVEVDPATAGTTAAAIARHLAGLDPAIIVRDSGPGIAAHDLSTVQQRHVRADASRLGYGLGLSIVGSIARQHGASFSLTSPVPGRSSGLQAMLVFAATDQADRTDQAD